jgi:NitT/TauT family transport system substrate-binding protein
VFNKRIATATVVAGVLAGLTALSATPVTAKTIEHKGAAPAMQTLNLAVYPSLDYAPMFVGLKEGIFAKYGLNLNITDVYTGAGLFAAISGGSDDLATNSPVTGANAIAQGLPIQLVQVTDYQPTKGNTDVIVAKNSPIKTLAQLAGKTIGISSVHGAFQLGLNYALEKAGVDPNGTNVLAVSPTVQGPTLLSGGLDAAVLQDPWLTQDLQSGSFRSLGNPFAKFPYKVPVGAFWATTSTLNSKPGLLRSFKQAWASSVAYSTKHPASLQSVIPVYTSLPPSLVKKMTLPQYATAITASSMTGVLSLMQKYGWITTPPAFSSIYWNGK